MKTLSKLALIAGMLLLSACATTAKYQQALSAWKGKNINQLIDAWGYPDDTMTAPDGNKVYIYRQSSVQNFPTFSSGGYTTVSTQGNQTVVTQTPTIQSGGGTYYFNCTTWVEFNQQDAIVRTRFRGNDCTAD